MHRKRKEALQIIENMLLNVYGDEIVPSASCFTSCMLSAMNTGDWEDVLILFDKMIKAGVEPNYSTFHGVLLAHARLDHDRHKVIDMIDQAIQRRVPMDRKTFQLSANVLFPDLPVKKNFDIRKLQSHLRTLRKGRAEVGDEALELNRSLGLADREDRRKSSKMKREDRITEDRDKSWRLVLERTLDLARAVETLH